ncbi:MAG: DUF6998 domain-containing protein [Neptuniibacter sp.]
MNLKELTPKELLQLQADATNELRSREIVRTQNNPLGDYTEWLVANRLNLELANNSKAGYDATDNSGVKIQIKGRRITPSNKSTQLSAIRNLKEKDFDELIAVIYDEYFNIIEAVAIPHEVVAEYATYRKHVNAHILFVKGPLLGDHRVKCIKQALSS